MDFSARLRVLLLGGHALVALAAAVAGVALSVGAEVPLPAAVLGLGTAYGLGSGRAAGWVLVAAAVSELVVFELFFRRWARPASARTSAPAGPPRWSARQYRE
jgi:hypothetical protein